MSCSYPTVYPCTSFEMGLFERVIPLLLCEIWVDIVLDYVRLQQ